MKFRPFYFVFVAVALLLSACNLPTAQTPAVGGISNTLAAQTLQAMLTQPASKPTLPALITATPHPATPSPSPVPTQPQPTNTPVPSSTATPLPPCDAAAFVSDVTVQDGTTLSPGAKFTKTWRLKNIGVCTWTTSYAAVFTNGNAMGAEPAIAFPGSVPPGQVFDLTVNLTAPSAAGTYRGNFKLRNGAGMIFGTGAAGTGVFYVEIKVAAPASINGSYSFIDNFCAADWSNASGSVSCTAKDGSSSGFVARVDKPLLENGSKDDESALLMAPQQVKDGVFRGKYPSVSVKAGDLFQTVVGCEDKATDCNVRFQLDYQIDNGDVKTLASWDETFDKTFHVVQVDLSGLAGKDVHFILTILANGSATGDRAVWLLPRITRPTPTPTATTAP